MNSRLKVLLPKKVRILHTEWLASITIQDMLVGPLYTKLGISSIYFHCINIFYGILSGGFV